MFLYILLQFNKELHWIFVVYQWRVVIGGISMEKECDNCYWCRQFTEWDSAADHQGSR